MNQDEKRKCCREIAEWFVETIKREKTRIKWLSSKRDLLEIIYIVYREGILRDKFGYPISMMQLTRSTCGLLRLPVPSNPTVLAQRAMERKGAKAYTVLERYHHDASCIHYLMS